MSIPSAAAETNVRTNMHQADDMRLRGRALLLARAAWLVVALLTLAVVVAAIPLEFARLRQICVSADCQHPRLTPHELRELQALGFSADFFAGYFITFVLVFVVVWFAAGAIIFWRKSDDRGALFVALFLVTFGSSFPVSGSGLRPAAPIWWLLSACVGFLGAATAGMFLYLFPDGRFVPQWTKWPAAGWIVLQFPRRRRGPAAPAPHRHRADVDARARRGAGWDV